MINIAARTLRKRLCPGHSHNGNHRSDTFYQEGQIQNKTVSWRKRMIRVILTDRRATIMADRRPTNTKERSYHNENDTSYIFRLKCQHLRENIARIMFNKGSPASKRMFSQINFCPLYFGRVGYSSLIGKLCIQYSQVSA